MSERKKQEEEEERKKEEEERRRLQAPVIIHPSFSFSLIIDTGNPYLPVWTYPYNPNSRGVRACARACVSARVWGCRGAGVGRAIVGTKIVSKLAAAHLLAVHPVPEPQPAPAPRPHRGVEVVESMARVGRVELWETLRIRGDTVDGDRVPLCARCRRRETQRQ